MLARRRGIDQTVTVLVILLLVLAVVAAVGWSYPRGGTATTITTTSTLTVLSNDAAAAEAECAQVQTCLTLYSTIDATAWTGAIGPAFFHAFPWASGKVNFLGLPAGQVTSRTLSEFQAGKVQTDMVLATIGIVYPILKVGAIQNYSNPLVRLQNYTSDAYDPGGSWVVVWRSIVVIQYNTNLTSPERVPHSWSDLADPIYKGKIAMQTAASLSGSGGLFYHLSTQMDNSSWTELMKGIAANQPIISTSSSAATDKIASGQAEVCPCLYNDYLDAKKSGAPIAVVLVNPTPYNPGVITIAKDAPHPAMARLMEDWLMSVGGQAALASSGRAPFQTDIGKAFGVVPTGVKLVNAFADPGPVFANPGKWSDLFKSIFGS